MQLPTLFTKPRVKLLLLFLAMLLATPSVLKQTWIRGDGHEYLLMTHAIYRHGSPLIRSSDIEELKALPQEQLQSARLPVDLLELVRKHYETYQPKLYGGFAATAPEHFYAIHFWFYSILAVPFYAVTTALGLNPAWAFALTNLAFALAVFLFLRRSMAHHVYVAFALFVMLGGSYYMSWTGPEVMAASCALMATVAMLGGELGFAVLLAGLGATQNPSLVFMIPFACGYRALIWKRPGLAWPGLIVGRVGTGELALVATGVALALLPYAFFQFVFGVPSLISENFNHPQLITWNRYFSLWFDLDQGMLIGVPGLLAALLAVPLLFAWEDRRRWLLLAAGVFLMVTCMAVPTLSAVNWNAGCTVMLRYAYWLAMPLLALLLLGFGQLRTGALRFLFVTVVVLQGATFAEYGVQGEHSNSVAHAAPVRWILRNFPAFYNPDPEIFYERSIGAEKAMLPTLTYLYKQDGQAVKLLRQQNNLQPTAEYCPSGQRLVGQNVRMVDGGWQYEHAPFHCQ